MQTTLTSITRRASAIDERARGAVLGAARVGLGLLWLANLHWKVPPRFGEDSGGGLYKYSASVSRHSPFAPFTWLTEQVVLPNFQLFGWLTLVIETLLAALLLIGYRTKVVALVGAVMTVPIMLSVLYYDRGDEWSWSYLLMIIGHLFAYASDAGSHFGLDGVLRGDAARARRASTVVGAIAIGIGAIGLFVARSVSFAGERVALLGSDAGFVNDEGLLVRRWELKFVWFNPLWAMLTIVLGALVVVGVRQRWASRVAAAGFAVLALVVLLVQHVDYVRDDGSVQVVSTASNVAMWVGLALAVGLLDRSMRRGADIVEPG
jgi:thiosulfate dehydrogenase [quinone] large subunit